MKWYTLNDKSCQFSVENGQAYGKINGRVFKLDKNTFVPVKEEKLVKNGSKKKAKSTSKKKLSTGKMTDLL